MSRDDVKLSLAKLGVILGVLAGIAGLMGAWFVLPYRMEAAENKIERVEDRQEEMRAVLIRVDENVRLLREEAAKR